MHESARTSSTTTTARAIVCCTLFALTISVPAQGSGSVLGYHTINLRLKPSPVADVLNMLSARSKATAKLPEGQRPSDEGRAWEVDGADKLEGIVVAVNFVETPVEQRHSPFA